MKAIKRFKQKLVSIKGWILNYKVRIILILLLYPNIVCYTPDSTGASSTVMDFLFGIGKYAKVTYNCEGQATSVTKYSFFDYGGSIRHNIDEFKFGVRGGGYSVKNLGGEDTYNNYYGDSYPYSANYNSTQYINPFIGFENKYFDLNFGVVFLSRRNYYGNIGEYLINYDGPLQPSWLLRIGNKEKFHFSTQYLSSVPLLSGGGMADAGFGFGSTETRNLTWIGLSFGPFQNLGLSVKQNIQVTDNLDILIRGRMGTIESNFEGGISAGVRFII